MKNKFKKNKRKESEKVYGEYSDEDHEIGELKKAIDELNVERGHQPVQ